MVARTVTAWLLTEIYLSRLVLQSSPVSSFPSWLLWCQGLHGVLLQHACVMMSTEARIADSGNAMFNSNVRNKQMSNRNWSKNSMRIWVSTCVGMYNCWHDFQVHYNNTQLKWSLKVVMHLSYGFPTWHFRMPWTYWFCPTGIIRGTFTHKEYKSWDTS